MAWRSHATWTDWKKPIHTVCKHTAFVYCVKLTPRSKCCFFFLHSFATMLVHLQEYTFLLCVILFSRFAVCCIFQLGSLLSLVDNLLPLVEHFLIRSNFLFLFITLFLLRHYCPFTAMLNVPNKCDNWNVRPVRVYFRFTAVGPNHIK